MIELSLSPSLPRGGMIYYDQKAHSNSFLWLVFLAWPASTLRLSCVASPTLLTSTIRYGVSSSSDIIWKLLALGKFQCFRLYLLGAVKKNIRCVFE